MLEISRIRILGVNDFPSRKHYDKFDAHDLEDHPVVYRRGKVRYKLGVIRRAYKGRDEIFGDIIIQGNFKGFVTKPDEETGDIAVKSVELVLE